MKAYYNGKFKIYTKAGKEKIYNKLGDIPKSYKITELYIEKNITKIPPRLCYYSDVRKIFIPEGVKEIGRDAFHGTNIKELNLPNSIEKIGDGAFNYCWQLSKITLPKKLKEIGDEAFACCKITELTIPNNVERIGIKAFTGCCELKKVTLSNKLKVIEKEAFYGNRKLEEVNIKRNLTTIENSAFEKCLSLKTINLPNSIMEIEDYAFNDCANLKEITIPKNMKVINNFVFNKCDNLQKIKLPEGLEEIKYGAFRWCPEITELNIPKSIKIIKGDILNESKIKSIKLPDDIKEIDSDFYNWCDNLKEIKYKNMNVYNFFDVGLYDINPIELFNLMIEKDLILPNLKYEELFSDETVNRIKEIDNKYLYLYCLTQAKTVEDLEKVVPEKLINEYIYDLNEDILLNRNYIIDIFKRNDSQWEYDLDTRIIDIYKDDEEIMKYIIKNAKNSVHEDFCDYCGIDTNNSELMQEIMAINPLFYDFASREDREVFVEAILDDIQRIYKDSENPNRLIIESSLCNIKRQKEDWRENYYLFLDDINSACELGWGSTDKVKDAIKQFEIKQEKER